MLLGWVRGLRDSESLRNAALVGLVIYVIAALTSPGGDAGVAVKITILVLWIITVIAWAVVALRARR